MINFYDTLINKLNEIINSFSPLDYSVPEPWQQSNQEEIILKSDSAFELGGNNASAISGILFTTSNSFSDNNQITVYDDVFPNQSEINSNSSINYARFVVIKLKNESVENKTAQQLYAIFKKLEYLRYHIFLKGFAIRVSSSQHKEVVRISKEAIKNQITLNSVGQAFIKNYLQLPEVESVKIILIASLKNNTVFNQLNEIALESEKITESLNEIFKGLKMDCSTCGQKQICDQIEGMKDFHSSL